MMPRFDAVEPQERGPFYALNLAMMALESLEGRKVTPEIEKQMARAVTRIALACRAVARVWLP